MSFKRFVVTLINQWGSHTGKKLVNDDATDSVKIYDDADQLVATVPNSDIASVTQTVVGTIPP